MSCKPNDYAYNSTGTVLRLDLFGSTTTGTEHSTISRRVVSEPVRPHSDCAPWNEVW